MKYCGPSYKVYESSKPTKEPEQPNPKYKPEPKTEPILEPRKEPEPQSNSLPLLKQKIIEQSKPFMKQPPIDSGVNDENIVSVDRAERVIIEKGKKRKKLLLQNILKMGIP